MGWYVSKKGTGSIRTLLYPPSYLLGIFDAQERHFDLQNFYKEAKNVKKFSFPFLGMKTDLQVALLARTF